MPLYSYTIQISQMSEKSLSVMDNYAVRPWKSCMPAAAERKSAFWQDISAVLNSLNHSEYVIVLSILNEYQK